MKKIQKQSHERETTVFAKSNIRGAAELTSASHHHRVIYLFTHALAKLNKTTEKNEIHESAAGWTRSEFSSEVDCTTD